MKLRKVTLFIFILTLGFISCNNDDDGGSTTIVIRDRTEQQLVDNDSILGYLETHYYNSAEFEGNSDPNIEDLMIEELLEGETLEDGYTLLIDAVETHTLVFAETNYEYYILRLNQGGGLESPNFTDTVRVTYEGYTLEDDLNDLTEAFDSTVNPDTPFDLLGLIPAWRKVLPQFNTADAFEETINVDTDGDGIPDISDGTIEYKNHGTGVMFIPSGLGYFSSATTGISAYSPLIFKFELYQMFENDHDRDGIPSYLEDLNNDGEMTVNFDDLTDDTDDDTDGDGTPDYADADDDGDGIPTINEDLNGDGDPTNDIGSNGIPNYLDPEETEYRNN
ncbi:FKBP-type peptidyl-prolyl cis-trans isomerase [Flaviramulus sp. BrNp1-15]|uniref:FKBP-type peptidyl-prolyl cis-trans isomerase n=1 Tax=Flaviramulus sp. BrNp1-15 TaxID=2916754 RepID=UPI00272E1F7D|nr:hypothetical protein [Flaviramulus sp. BrNp1-15]